MDERMDGGGAVTERRNLNRGYRKLRVWQDAREYYALTWRVVSTWGPLLRRIAANHLASVSGLQVYRDAGHLASEQSEEADALAYRIENGLMRLVESLRRKRAEGDWSESYSVREAQAPYGPDGVTAGRRGQASIHPSIPGGPRRRSRARSLRRNAP
jgi:hypothetical protein